MSSVEGKERIEVRGQCCPAGVTPAPPLLPCVPLPGTVASSQWGLLEGVCRQVLTLLNAKAAGPFLQGDVLVVVQVAGLKEAGGAVLHGDERGTERGQLSVGQVPAKVPYCQHLAAGARVGPQPSLCFELLEVF